MSTNDSTARVWTSDLCGLPCLQLSAGKFPTCGRGVRKSLKYLNIEVATFSVRGGQKTVVNLSDLPPETQIAYLQRRAGVAPAEADPALWDAFQRSAVANQEEAARRHPIIMALAAKIEAGATLKAALAEMFRETGTSPASLNRWYSRVDGKPEADWLPLLAPDWKPGGRKADVSEDAWRFYAGWLGRPEKPKFAVAYRKTKEAAEFNGWKLPSCSTM
ncbi:MAG: DNA-binding domain-containing protein [Rhodospirillaceae bacterium]